MLRKIILIGLVSAMLLGLVATAQEPVTVEFWHRFSESRLPYLYQLSEWFEAEYPHISIEWVYQGGYSALQQKINGAVVAGEVPTMTIFYENWIPPIEDALLPLEPYLTDAEKADILPGLRYPGYLTIPFNKSIMVLVYIEEFVDHDLRFCKFHIRALAFSGTLGLDNLPGDESFLVDARFFARDELVGLTVYPPILKAQFWDDLDAGFPETRYLGLRRIR